MVRALLPAISATWVIGVIQSKDKYETTSRVVIPILSNGDPIGSVTVLPPEGRDLSDLEIKTAELGAGFLAKQMES